MRPCSRPRRWRLRPGVRACRSHEGTQTNAAQRQQEAKETEVRRQAEFERKQQERHHLPGRPDAAEMLEFRLWSENHCWTCGNPGISMQEFFLKLMVASKRLELKGKFNFLLGMTDDLREEMGSPTVLAVIPYIHKTDHRIIRVVVKDRIKSILPLLGQVRMCGDCIKKFGVQDRLEALMPHPSMEQIEAVLPIVALLDPVLTALATDPPGGGEN